MTLLEIISNKRFKRRKEPVAPDLAIPLRFTMDWIQDRHDECGTHGSGHARMR